MIPMILLFVTLGALDSTASGATSADSLAAMLKPDIVQVGAPTPLLVPGARVRVQSPSLGKQLVVGRVVTVAADTLRLRVDDIGGTMPVLLNKQTRVELSTEHHTRLAPGILIGGLLGGAIGGVIVAYRQTVNDVAETFEGIFSLETPTHHEVSNAPLLVGLMLGGALGGIVGNGMHADRWVPVTSPTRVSLGGSCDPSGHFRVAVSLSLLPTRRGSTPPRRAALRLE